MRVSLTVGRGGWSFYKPDVELRACPHVGDHIAASGDGRVYDVDSVTITPTTIYVRCSYLFESEEEATEAGREWD